MASEWPMTGSRVEDETTKREAAFTAFVRESQDPIRHALSAGFGVEVGREAAEEALVYAWRHWDRVARMRNPRGYVYRVGHRMAQKMRRQRPTATFPEVASPGNPVEIEPGLPAALRGLSGRQRTVVVLVSAYGLSQRETAQMLGITRSSVQRHLERGLARLRRELGVNVND
jgi:RNA polymerase sigma factor (sigma-70 family)